MPKIAPRTMTTLTIDGVIRYARCWRIETTSGSVITVTDHDLPLTVNGEVYSPMSGGSANQTTLKIQGDNFDIRSFIDDSSILETDIINGYYNDAEVREFVVDSRYPFAGVYRSNTYYIHDLRWNPETKSFEAECQTILGRCQKKVGSQYSRTCDFIYGEPNTCASNTATYSDVIDVTSVNSDGTFVSTPPTFDETGYFDEGYIVWTSGNNLGHVSVVKSYITSTKVWSLYLSPPSTIQASDIGYAVPGCNHRPGVNVDGSLNAEGHCLNKFNNLLRIGAAIFTPSNDKLYETPDAKTGDL